MNPSLPTQAVEISPADAPSATEVSTNSGTPGLVPLLYVSRPKVGEKVGVVSFPRLKESWTIHEGTDSTQLSRGVGHFRGSVLPGVVDNTVLSGHRTTVFKHLGKLRKGDLIYVKTSAGVFTYKVRKFRIVLKSNRTVIVPSKTAILTLTTCYPFVHYGPTTKAFIVVSDLVSSKLAR